MLKDDLLGPDVELRETHISWVFLDGDDVWKVKKPADFGFLDFSTPEKRREACQAEVDLNRRLAPDVYLGVVPVTRDERGRHQIGGEGEPIDWAVHMRRLADGDNGEALLKAGLLDLADIKRIARHVAGFHEKAKCDEETSRFGRPEAIAENVEENFQQTRDRLDDYLGAEQVQEIKDWQRAFLRNKAELLERRIEEGRIRDGHGDLRLEHIYLPGRGSRREAAADARPVIIDCIEFNDRFRYADVCADIGFLAMDLGWHGRTDLAESLLAAYARASQDYGLYEVIDFYESYRAFVRGKVATFLVSDEDAPREDRRRASREARRYFLLALASERRSLLPARVFAVGGLIASGKSTAAGELSERLSAPVVDSDRARKHLAGVSPRESLEADAFQGFYAPEFTGKVYRELARRADTILRSGRSVILDASFANSRRREAIRDLARRRGAPFTFIECRAPREVLKDRLEQRGASPGVSDARAGLLDDFIENWEAVDLPEGEHVVLRTDRQRLEDIADRLLGVSAAGS